MSTDRHAWIDATAGVAGDMLLAACIDAGAELTHVQQAVDAVVPGSVRIAATTVTRAGLRALDVDVEPLVADPPHRTWHTVRELLTGAALPDRVRDRATAVFARLAEAEARVHGVAVDDVHFHEVGALDSIADVVGLCAALDDLDVTTVTASEIALGSGRIRSEHGVLPVPAPAVAELARGWRVSASGSGELATPTGVAAIRVLATACEDLPTMTLDAVGIGAGSRDTPGRPNVVRLLVGTVAPSGRPANAEPAVVIEANVDDLDPRLWPEVLAGLLRLGAADAWLVPIVMKKGRPAHTLHVLTRSELAEAVRERIFRDTSTLGVRERPLHRFALPRAFVDVNLGGTTIAVKLGHRDGVITHMMPEFDDVAAAARRLGLAERVVLQQAVAAAAANGIVVGSALPDDTRPA